MHRANGPAMAVLLAGAAWLGGCASAPATGPNPARIDTDNFDAIFAAARDSLRTRSFEEDRVDRRAGVITTLPSTAAMPWEPWRHDNADAEGRGLAALNTIRKSVTVDVRKAEPGGGYDVAVTVTQQRREMPTVEPTSTVEAFSIFNFERSLLTESTEPEDRDRGLERRGIAWWADLGRDTALEQAILADIRSRVAHSPAH